MKLDKVDCRRGAPMGRYTDTRAPLTGKTVSLERVYLNSGGYDNGGAYWGHGQRLYRALDTEGEYVEYVRAKNRQDASDQLNIEGYLIRPNRPAIRVMYRMIEGECIAILPDLPANASNYMSYMHIGQHSECGRSFLRDTVPATVDEYSSLHNELLGRGYNLRIVGRIC